MEYEFYICLNSDQLIGKNLKITSHPVSDLQIYYMTKAFREFLKGASQVSTINFSEIGL